MSATITEIPLNKIDPGDNDRKKFDEEAIAQLAESIADVGLVQPITVRKKKNRFEVVAGERRWRAHLHLGAETIEAMVVSVDDRKAAERMLAENTARVDLNPIEEANAYAKAMSFGSTVERISKVSGVGQLQIQWRLELLKLEPELQAMVVSGALTVRMGWSAAQLEPYNARRFVREVVGQSLTSQQSTSLFLKLQAAEAQDSLFEMAIEEFTLEKEREERKATRRQLEELLEEVIPFVDDDLAARIAVAIGAEE